MDTKILRYKDARIIQRKKLLSRYLKSVSFNTKIQGYKDTRMQRYLDTRILRYMHIKIQGYIKINSWHSTNPIVFLKHIKKPQQINAEGNKEKVHRWESVNGIKNTQIDTVSITNLSDLSMLTNFTAAGAKLQSKQK